MRKVKDHLCRAQGGALLLGADTPQLCVADLVAAVRALDDHDHVLGPSADGGFWLFGTRMAVPAAAWSHTPWSRPDTSERFAAALGPRHIARLRTLRDADTVEDLAPLLDALEALPTPLPEQIRLLDWLREQGSCRSGL
jgi:glycosyltransferase A (GT-A) superfamily protein (DUF2064 family)